MQNDIRKSENGDNTAFLKVGIWYDEARKMIFGGRPKRATSPYLKEGRLSDVIAALQIMAMNPRYRRTVERWAYYIGGAKQDTEKWRAALTTTPNFQGLN